MEPMNVTGRDNPQPRHFYNAEDENNNYLRFGIEPVHSVANNIELLGDREYHTLSLVLPFGTDETDNAVVVEEEAQTCEIINLREQKEKSSSESSSGDEPVRIAMKKIQGSSNNIVWQDQSLFKCNQCSYGSNKRYILLRHLKTHHKNCEDNEINNKKTNHNAENYEEVANDGPLINEMKLFSVKDSDGIDNNDGNELPNIFNCSECPYTTNIRYYLTRHTRTHSGVKPHTCIICERGFKSVYGLQNHIKVHKGVKNNICKFCGTAFTTPGDMKRHIKYKHTQVKPHKCTECDYAAVERFKLQRHMRFHTGERPYQCQDCSYASFDLSKLNRHHRTHTGENPYKCDVCNTSFADCSSLKQHRLVIHKPSETEVYSCELCPVKTTRKRGLRNHITRIHLSNKHLKCAGCGVTFSDRYSYKLHLKSIQHERHFKCQLCSFAAKRFDYLRKHMILHEEEKPAKCESDLRTKCSVPLPLQI